MAVSHLTQNASADRAALSGGAAVDAPLPTAYVGEVAVAREQSQRDSRFSARRGVVADAANSGGRSRLGIAVRSISESVACLIVAVIILRMFLIEGYIISTGSMAPNLYGYHKQAQCPACGHRFAFGVAFDRDGFEHLHITSCPNCDQPGITLVDVPRNDGDQLLVFKNAYAFRDPRRWEIVVFMNPADPTEAYVKRVAGLPNDRIQVVDGDVFINDRRAQKPLDIQRAMRILVFDQSQPVRSASWIPRWIPDGKWKLNGQAFELGADEVSFADGLPNDSEEDTETGSTVLDTAPSSTESISWVQYMHWPRLPLRDREAVLDGTASLEPRPITDRYGYNPHESQDDKTDVNDLMLDVQMTLPLLSQFVTVLRSRDELVVCQLDRAEGTIEAWVCPDTRVDFQNVLSRRATPFAIGKLPGGTLDEGLHLEVSAFDRQLLVAINDRTVITRSFDDAAEFSHPGSQRTTNGNDPTASIGGRIESENQADLPHGFRQIGDDNRPTGTRPHRSKVDPSQRSSISPVRFGAVGSGVQVHSVRVFRDVHYTSRDSQHAINSPVELGSDEFFFLGDNSPVSLDSRGWRNPVVSRRLIVGKPLVVHLPSRPTRLQIGNWVQHVRVPDFARIRVIR